MNDQHTIQNVTVVGGGQMGTGIAHAFASSGFDVILVDPQQGQLTKAQASIEGILNTGVKLGKLDSSAVAKTLGRLTLSTSLTEALTKKPCDLLVETATENMAIKIKILEEADRLLPAHGIIGSNTSAISITEIGACTQRPDRVVGLHFFNPVHKMKLLEIIRGLSTGDETVAKARAIGERLSKTLVVINDSPGMATSRISAMIGNEAMYMLQEGLGSAEDIDTAMRTGLNHPMGPLELGDLTGWDTRLSVLQYLHQTLGEKFRPCPLLTKMVKAGHVGRKVGRGVYEYRDGQKIEGSGLKVKA